MLRSTLPYATLRASMWMRERRRTKILAQQRLARSPAKPAAAPPSHERRPSMLARLINAIASSSSDSTEPSASSSSSSSSSSASASASAPYSRAVSASELAIQVAAGQLTQPHADEPSAAASAAKPTEQPVHIALVLALIRHFKKGRLLSTMLVVRLLMRARTVLKALPNVVRVFVFVCARE